MGAARVTDLTARARAWSRAEVEPGVNDPAPSATVLRQRIASAAAHGFLGVQVPQALGGLGLPFSAKLALGEALAQVDFGSAMAVLNTHNVAEQLARLWPQSTAAPWVRAIVSGERVACTALTEPEAGSDFAAIQTRATRTAAGWQLDGQKTWIINACYADLVVVYAQTDPQRGAAGIGAFLVEAQRPGFQRVSEQALGTVPTLGVGGFRLEGYVCPAEAVVSPPGEAFKDILHAINGARTYVAAMCCGMVEACLQIAAEYGQSRHTFGKPLMGHQGWRWALAQASVDLAAARLLVGQAAAHIDAEADAQVSAAQAKIFATGMAQTHIAKLLHAMGAEGLHAHHPFTRHLQAVQAATLTDGATEMLLERVARQFNRPSNTP